MQPAAAVSVENTHTRDVITSTGERERERERGRENLCSSSWGKSYFICLDGWTAAVSFEYGEKR